MSDFLKETLFDKKDFDKITNLAKQYYIDKAFPKRLGEDKKVVGSHRGEAVNLCLIEATITYLNSKDLLKQLPKFDYKE